MNAIDIYIEFEEDAKRICRYYNLQDYYINDVLSNFYLKLHSMEEKKQLDRLIINNKLNAPYLFSVVSNLVHDFRKVNNPYVDELDEVEQDDYSEDDKLRTELIEYATKYVPKWFDRKLFEVYYSHGHSIRSLAKDTHISTTTVHYSLQNSRAIIADAAKHLYKKI